MKGCTDMDEVKIAYKGEFTIEQRKAMTAQMLQELRKMKKLSQKEVAAELNIPATTYNTYESGRTEPPIEILVRLSYLYGYSVDTIVQRERMYKTADDVLKHAEAFKQQIADLDRQIAEKGIDAPGVPEFIETMNRLADAMTAYSQTETVKRTLNKPWQDKA